MPSQIIGQGAKDHPRRGQIAGRQRRILQPPDADRQIETMFDDIDDAVVEVQFDPDIGMKGQKIADEFAQMADPELGRRIDAQYPPRRALGRADVLFGHLQHRPRGGGHLWPTSVRLNRLVSA